MKPTHRLSPAPEFIYTGWQVADIEKAGLLAVRAGRVLLCRKRRGTRLLILPGGRYEAGEDGPACLARELSEELGEVRVDGLAYLGTYTDVAASAPGEPSRTVRIDLFLGELMGDPAPRSEILELVWFGESDDAGELAPSLRNSILPDLIGRGILAWRGFVR